MMPYILHTTQGSLGLGVMVFLLTLGWISLRFYFFVSRRWRARQNLRNVRGGEGDDAENRPRNLLMDFLGRQPNRQPYRGQEYPFQVNSCNTI